jgi:hypothetical protein
LAIIRRIKKEQKMVALDGILSDSSYTRNRMQNLKVKTVNFN